MTNGTTDQRVAAGGNGGLPEDIHEMADPRSGIVAWTSFDVAREQDLPRCECGRLADVLCFFPWMLPCFFLYLPAKMNDIKGQYWILTETDLITVTRNHDECCFPNVRQSGDTVQTIPLENITTSEVQSQQGHCCGGEIPMVKIYTPCRVEVDENDRPKAPRPAAVGVGLSQHDWFMREVFSWRDIVKNPPAGARAFQTCSPMERSESPASHTQISPGLNNVFICNESEKQNKTTMTHDLREAETPQTSCFGSDSAGLPESVCQAAQLAGRHVVAWITHDRSCDRGLDCGWFSLYIFYFLLPFTAWCPLVLGFLSLPVYLLMFTVIAIPLYRNSRGNRNLHWILTDSDLREVSDGVLMATISLPTIARCRITTRGKGCLDRHVALSSTICVETASDEEKERSIGASDFAECKWFIREVLNQRNHMTDGVIRRPKTNRLRELSELLESGLLTQEEFGEKHREVFNSV
jgi:hypothetical protein